MGEVRWLTLQVKHCLSCLPCQNANMKVLSKRIWSSFHSNYYQLLLKPKIEFDPICDSFSESISPVLLIYTCLYQLEELINALHAALKGYFYSCCSRCCIYLYTQKLQKNRKNENQILRRKLLSHIINRWIVCFGKLQDKPPQFRCWRGLGGKGSSEKQEFF